MREASGPSIYFKKVLSCMPYVWSSTFVVPRFIASVRCVGASRCVAKSWQTKLCRGRQPTNQPFALVSCWLPTASRQLLLCVRPFVRSFVRPSVRSFVRPSFEHFLTFHTFDLHRQTVTKSPTHRTFSTSSTSTVAQAESTPLYSQYWTI